MAQPPSRRPSGGSAQVHTVLLIAASVVIGVLVALALVQWFGRMQ